MSLFGGDDDDDGKLHNLDTSSGKIAFHASSRSDDEESGEDEDKREDRAGKKSWTNSLLMVDVLVGMILFKVCKYLGRLSLLAWR